MILTEVGPYEVREPLFEGVRVILSARGEAHSPAYIQGISGAALRIAGICPCAPTCSSAMEVSDLISLLGYGYTYLPLHDYGPTPRVDLEEVLVRIKDEIRAGRPALAWHAFTIAEWDVVCGFDEEKATFHGRGSYAGLGELATAPMARLAECDVSPPQGAILIRDRVRSFDPTAAEVAALREAVRHARASEPVRKIAKCSGDWLMLEGIRCYDRWVQDFGSPDKLREAADAYCHGVYRSTHRAAAGFLREIAPRYSAPGAQAAFRRAADHFQREADLLDQATGLLGWDSPVGPDPVRNQRAAAVLGKARDHYVAGIEGIEWALEVLEA